LILLAAFEQEFVYTGVEDRPSATYALEAFRRQGIFGEVLAAASTVKPGDYDGWHDAYRATADRLYAEAADAGPVTARDLLLRASTYYFSAEFFLHGNPADPRIAAAYDRSVECFRRAGVAEPVEIPYGGTVLRGYFYRAPGDGPKPLLIMHNGFDGSAEECHFMGAAAGASIGAAAEAVACTASAGAGAASTASSSGDGTITVAMRLSGTAAPSSDQERRVPSRRIVVVSSAETSTSARALPAVSTRSA